MQSKLSKYLLLGLFTLKQPIYSVYNQGGTAGEYNPELSLCVEERVSEDFTYKSWTGFVPSNYISTEHDLLYYATPRFGIGAGINYSYSFQNNINLERTQIRAILEYKLW